MAYDPSIVDGGPVPEPPGSPAQETAETAAAQLCAKCRPGKPLSETLLGGPDDGGLAGQGGMRSEPRS